MYIGTRIVVGFVPPWWSGYCRDVPIARILGTQTLTQAPEWAHGVANTTGSRARMVPHLLIDQGGAILYPSMDHFSEGYPMGPEAVASVTPTV